MRGERLTLCFFVDALGWELAERTGVFKDVAPHAYRQRTVLGYSCAAQPTILTGLDPSEHGHWGMYYRTEASELAPLSRLRLLPRAVRDNHRFRRRLLSYHRRRSGFSGYYNFYRIPFELFATFDIVEKRDIFAPGAFDGGVRSIFDLARERGLAFRSWSWKTPLAASLAELESEIRTGALGFALLYTPHVDALLHGRIDDDAHVARELRSLEDRILRAVSAAEETYDEVQVLIYSDHGMIRTTDVVDLMGIVGRFGLKERRDYLVFYDSTMARFWFLNEGARSTVVEGLSSLDSGSILSDEELRREGIHFDDGRFGELVFLMDPGVLIVPSHMGLLAPKGMHGFSPEHADSYAVLMSNRRIEPEPPHIRDTFRVMKDLVV